jgi:CheY-like chemotaxis protein
MENAQLGLALGASAYLRKPATPPEIAHSLRAHTQAPQRDVLIVDDDPRTREMLQRIFRRQGVAAHEVGDGSQALAWLEANAPPGVIILDLAMPVTDGFAVIDRLAGDVRWRDIPVIVLTAKDLTGLELAALRRHVQQIFQKGRLERDALMAAVRAELQRPPGPSRSTG